MNSLLNLAITASIDAGLEILKVYYTDFDVEYKEDKSPLTVADKNANNRIISYLESTEIPILSEEGKTIPYVERHNWQKLWIVDPLDGTKEFIKKNDEFTVNIALVENNNPTLGVIYAPVLDILYFGHIGEGAYRCMEASKKIDNLDELVAASIKLPVEIDKDYYGVVASRSHMSDETTSFIESLRKEHSNI